MSGNSDQQLITQFRKTARQANRKKHHLTAQIPWFGCLVLRLRAAGVEHNGRLPIQRCAAASLLRERLFAQADSLYILPFCGNHAAARLPSRNQGDSLFDVFLRRVLSPFRPRMTISPEQFITSLCRALLQRHPDREGLAICVKQLEGGMALDDAIKFFISTNEYQTRIRASVLEAEGVLGGFAHGDETRAKKSLAGLAVRTSEASDPNILFLQTADPYHYYDMLAETSRTVRAYCQKHGFRYESYAGIKRGFYSWHAAYNRIIILRELLESGFSGWVFYLDADAFIANLEFDLREYLRDKSGYAGIFVDPGKKDEWYHMNNGIFLINMAANAAHDLIQKWFEEFMKISDHELRLATDWGYLRHDQDLLHVVFYDNQDFRSSIFLESPYLLGWDGFVRQITRGEAEGLAERKRIIKRYVEEVMGPSESASEINELSERDARVIVSTLYRALLGAMPDWDTADNYILILREEGLQYGLSRVVEAIIETEQFKTRFAAGSETTLALEQAKMVGGALYRSLYEREPDWHALNAIPAQLREQGLEAGLQNVIAEMIRCNEFRIGHDARQRAAATPEPEHCAVPGHSGGG
ncbi:MAG: hypothetical protein AB7T18_09000 [Alphaproteobacteria bacterium]